ncbi:hypothetical protein [Pleionea sp. CnH1-48]|uniref:hypothetical protein n=1 Tax=Pleionea sp. CnH1-48 TaxID=2954494 RepID=UPI0020980C4C|nr:hypothetical protein [Pleionea sp. CnH1-48]MCO7226583.1 hypothetical protein [Pleionea sp. CnH1-48]
MSAVVVSIGFVRSSGLLMQESADRKEIHLNKKEIVIIMFIGSLFYFYSKVSTGFNELLYKFTYYGSLPWSFPWFDTPFLACLDDCGSKLLIKAAFYFGFILNTLVVYFVFRQLMKLLLKSR